MTKNFWQNVALAGLVGVASLCSRAYFGRFDANNWLIRCVLPAVAIFCTILIIETYHSRRSHNEVGSK